MISEFQDTVPQRADVPPQVHLDYNKYENVLEHMDSGIMLFDNRGILTFINVQMAKLLELPRDLLSGCTLMQMLSLPQMSRFKKKKILRIYRETIFHRKRYHELTDEYGRHWLVTVTYGDQMDGDFYLASRMYRITSRSSKPLIKMTSWQCSDVSLPLLPTRFEIR